MTDAEHAVELELLRAQVHSCWTQVTRHLRAHQRAEAVLQQYLETLFPHLFPQALAQPLSIVEAAEYFYDHHLQGVAALPPCTTATIAPTPPPAAQSPDATDIPLSGDAVKFLYAAGLHVVGPEIKALWAQHTGKAVSTAKNTVLPELLDRGLLRVEQIPVPRYLTGYASDTCYLLTAAGRAEYRRRFNAEAITFEQAYAPHKSPEAWWQLRAVKALILAGNTQPANSRFTYTVYDPTGDPEAAATAGFQRRYGHSEPDLIVVVASQTQGAPSLVALESERGSYNATRLKSKVLKNLQDYGAAGFHGCYYVANNGDTARTLAGALSKVRADLKARPAALTVRSFLALFTLEALRDTWLPTPRFIDTEFFDRRTRQVSARWPPAAARPERYFRYVPPASPAQSQEADDES